MQLRELKSRALTLPHDTQFAVRYTLTVISVLTALLFVGVAPAAAKLTHFYIGSFGPGVLGSGSFTSVKSIATDASGDVYVYDGEASTLYKFNSAGEPVDFSALGTNALIAGVPAGVRKSEIAVSSAGANQGNIYIVNRSTEGVSVFSGSGELTGELAPSFGTCGVATDLTGAVYIANQTGQVDKYSSTESYLSSLRLLGSELCNLAVDSEGNAYISTFAGIEEQPGPVMKYAASQFLTEEQFHESGDNPSEGIILTGVGGTVSIDRSTDDLYVDEEAQVSQFRPSGSLISRFANSGTGSIHLSRGIAVAPNGDIYVPDNSSGVVKIYGPAVILPAVIESESVTDISSAGAVLRAAVNPNGLATAYHFEYGTSDCSAPASACAVVPAGGDAAIRVGETTTKVGQHIGGLAPETTYHYRLVVSSSSGGGIPVDGPDHIFTTQGTGSIFALPDDRSWEMVSPIEKNGSDIPGIGGISLGGVVQAAENGNSITYVSRGAFASAKASPVGVQYLASRSGQGDWLTDSIVQPVNSSSYGVANGAPYRAFSSDLASGLELISTNNALAVVATDNAEAAVPSFGGINFEGATPDLKYVLIPVGGTVEGDLYEWSSARGLQAVNVLPGALNGATTPGAELGSSINTTLRNTLHAVSDDGSRVFFTDRGDLYVREDLNTASPRTLLIAEGGVYQDADSSASKVFYTVNGALFRYDLTTGITSTLASGGGVLGVLGASSDASSIYYVSSDVVVTGANREGTEPVPTQPNLYVWHDGSNTFVGTLSASDFRDWEISIAHRASRVSHNGLRAVFISSQSLTGYDNTNANSGEVDTEVFEFDLDAGKLSCISCNPNGGLPTGPSSIPGGTPYTRDEAIYQSRVVSDDGSRVFFNSADALVPQDVNGAEDVYEWENGHAYLVSGGLDDQGAEFVDASGSGDDVFFITGESLIPQDLNSTDLYDARVGGGVPRSITPPGCAGTGCQGIPSATPIFATPASETFAGVGNFPVIRESTVKSHNAAKPTKAKRKKRKAKIKKRTHPATVHRTKSHYIHRIKSEHPVVASHKERRR